MRAFGLALCLWLLAGLPARAGLPVDPAGTYRVDGETPGNGPYDGTVEVTRNGDIYRVTWTLADQHQTVLGFGILNGNCLAVAFDSMGTSGLALFCDNGSGWAGTWTEAGATVVGTEHWSRR